CSHLFANKSVPLIRHSNDELKFLEEHTGINHMSIYEEIILSHFSFDDDLSLINIHDMIFASNYENPITNIQSICKNLYYVSTTDKSWTTSLIINDNVDHLDIGDIISCIYSTTHQRNIPMDVLLNKHSNMYSIE